ncbi:MAG: CoxG family protein [Candidatus Binatia bacterium]
MIFEDKFSINAPRQDVWDFLWDTEKMTKCVPGVENVKAESDSIYSFLVKTKVGFLSANFNVRATILESEAPVRLVSIFEGKDSKIASRVKQRNSMELVEISPWETEMRYKSDLTLTGKLATLGRMVVRAKAKQLMKEFSETVKKEIEKSVVVDMSAKEA